jgi:ankyrin repeat protein
MRAILKGRGTSTFSPEKPPWSVQVELAERYKHLSLLKESIISGYAHLNLAVCYYLGLGVQRNAAKVGEHVHASALRGIPQARLIIYPLSELLGFDIRTQELQAVKDPENDEELGIILAAMDQKPYRTPFTELLHLRSRRLSRLEVRPEELHLAVVFDNFEATKSLLESGATDSPNDNGQTALLLSCQNGNFQIAKLLLEHGSDPSIADGNGYTALHLLCMFQDEDISRFCRLIQVVSPNVDVEAFSSIPYFLPDFWDALVGTPLQWATAAGNLTAVAALLALGASPTNYPAWFSPIQIASYLLLPDILEILVEKSPSTPNIQDHGLFFLNEAHPFRQIMIHGKGLPKAIERTVQKLSSDQGVDISAPWGTTPLMKVALTNISSTDVIIVRKLLERCNTQIDGLQFSTIQAGIQGCNGSLSESLSEITLMLIDAGFSTRAVSSNDGSWPGWNAMHWAAAGTSLEIVERLFNRDPELLQIQTSFETKDTPLHIAARASYGLKMVRLLLRLGADPCAEAGYGQFPLVNCIAESRLQLDMQKFEALLEANAVNGYVVQNDGSTILHHVALRAARLSQEDLPGHELLRYILNRSELSGLINKKNDKGITPLHLVCYRPDYASIRLLVEAGADFHLRTPEPELFSPLKIVLEYARAPSKGIAGKDLGPIWHRFAYRAACYLADCTAGTPQDPKLTRLHIAAYCGYTEEVRKLVEQESANLYAKTATGFTPLEALCRLLFQYHQTQTIIDPEYLRRAQEIMRYLLSQQQINVESQ